MLISLPIFYFVYNMTFKKLLSPMDSVYFYLIELTTLLYVCFFAFFGALLVVIFLIKLVTCSYNFDFAAPRDQEAAEDARMGGSTRSS